MKEAIDTLADAAPGAPSSAWPERAPARRSRIAGYAVYLVSLTLAFAAPLVNLTVHAAQHSLHSHIPLIPLMAGYLFYIRPRTAAAACRASIAGTLLLACVGAASLAAAVGIRETLSVNDYLALTTTAYVSLAAAGGFLFLGSTWMRAAAFPFGFLVFMIPLPDAAVYWLERGSVLASAEVTHWLLTLTGTPALRQGTVFALPGIVLEVAQECSGIRSSWVLFITSVFASNMFLSSGWRRVALVAFTVPLAIVRNGFRILVIALLCVYIGPHMIDSQIHHRGGPIFFALSLVPLFGWLLWLRRGDRHAARLRSPARPD
jgi:exosortase C (VPDSG-CTERM-specific)